MPMNYPGTVATVPEYSIDTAIDMVAETATVRRRREGGRGDVVMGL
jgi:hypothetical protein